MKEVTPDEMRKIEDNAEALGVSRLLMMENAGSSLARFIKERFSPLSNKRIVIICGTGNNGGDGLVCARHLAGLALLEVFLLGTPEQVKTLEAKTNLDIIFRMRSISFYHMNSKEFSTKIADSIGKADIIVDAIFGTGVKGALREPHSSVIDMINSSNAFKVAVDIPSGLDSETGGVHDRAIRADATLTFHRAKKGLLGREFFTGELITVPIGIPPEAEM